MRVLVTGGTGFAGPDIVRAVRREGHDVTALVHRSAGPFTEEPGLRLAQGDATDAARMREVAQGHDAVVHLVAIRRAFPKRGLTFERMHTEATRHVVEAAKAAGAKRFVYMSAHGVEAKQTDYQRTKVESEEIVKASGIPWTIFRPTFIVGKREGGARGFDDEFADIVRKFPILPKFGGGRFKIQPVARRDVALAFARSLSEPKAHGKTYVLAGPTTLTWSEYLRTLARLLGKRRALAPAPMPLVMPAARLFGRFSWFPASADELRMLVTDHTADASAATHDLGVRFTPFEEAIAFLGEERKAKEGRGAKRASGAS